MRAQLKQQEQEAKVKRELGRKTAVYTDGMFLTSYLTFFLRDSNAVSEVWVAGVHR